MDIVSRGDYVTELSSLDHQYHSSLDEKAVTPDMIKSKLLNLKLNKSAGPDKLNLSTVINGRLT